MIALAAFLTTPRTVHAVMILPALCFAATAVCAVAMRRADVAQGLEPHKAVKATPPPSL
jgi:hypothetical protein